VNEQTGVFYSGGEESELKLQETTIHAYVMLMDPHSNDRKSSWMVSSSPPYPQIGLPMIDWEASSLRLYCRAQIHPTMSLLTSTLGVNIIRGLNDL
jgi:hypothetical protein